MESSGKKIGRITTAGVIMEFPLPFANSLPWAITSGPDGALWFIEQAGNKIGRITTAAAITEFAIPTANSQPYDITTGPGGHLWFTQRGGKQDRPDQPVRKRPSCLLAVGVSLALACAAALSPQSAAAEPKTGLPSAAASRVIVGLRVPWKAEGLSTASERDEQRRAIASAQSRLTAALQGTGAVALHRYETIPFQVLSLTPAAEGVLLTSDLVASVEPDRLLRPTLAESGPLVQADQAWALGFTGAGIAVAILDSGVESAHSFFGGRVAAEACFSTIVSGQSTSLCPNGQATQVGPGAASPSACASLAGCDHGTHVAGIAAGAGASFSGVGRGASIIGVNVFARISAAACGGAPCLAAYTSDVIRGLEHVFSLRNAYPIAAVNMSLGGGLVASQSACDAANASTKAVIDNLRSVGIATVIASGNAGSTTAIDEPACISTAVAVGSTTKQDGISSFSNSSPMVDLLAPGSSITSSITGNGFGPKSGTSMSTPHVAGAWAVLKQIKPTASVSEVLSALAASGQSVTDNRNGITRSRIRVKSALDVILGPPPSISIDSTSVYEGDAGMVTAIFTVTLSRAYLLTVSVDYATAGSSATSGTDFIAAQGTLVFPPGTTTRAISVTVVGDYANEGDETFLVNLSNPVNGAITFGQGTGTILNTDASGFAIADVAIAEPRSGTANAVFTVTQSPALGGVATVGFQTVAGSAVAPADFNATAGTLTFAAGQTSQIVTVSVDADAVAEVTETFHVDLSGSSGPVIARSRGTATIHDPGFYSVTPCRVLDTRVSAQGPALSAGVTRTVVVGGACGVPKAARAASLNVTVVSPTGAGNLRLFPPGVGVPLVSAINYSVGQTRANNGTVALSPEGWLSVFCGQAAGTVDLILDVNGYFE